MRQITRLPGAARATFSTSASQSTANSVTPSSKARGDLALLLDGVAVGDALGRGAGGQHVFGLADRGDVEARSRCRQQLEDFRRRIGLDGVEHLGVRQRLGEGEIVLADDVEVDHEAGSFVVALLEKFADACGHRDRAP